MNNNFSNIDESFFQDLVKEHYYSRFEWTGKERIVTSPYTNKAIARLHDTHPNDLPTILPQIKKSQAQWASLTTKKRCQVLYAYLELLRTHRDTLAYICHMENGKLITEAQAGVDKAIEICEYAASLPQLISGSVQEVSGGIECKDVRRPLGIVASITPFNFPVMVPHWTMPLALGAGNALVLKPSEQTPLSAIYCAGLWKKAGLPPHLLTIVIGEKELVEVLCDHPDCMAVTFVGSTPVARTVYQRASQSLKRVVACGGAKNYLIVHPDAHPKSADDIVSAFTGMSGQRCMAASVLVLVQPDHPRCKELLDAILQKTRSMEYKTHIPPLISPLAVQKVQDYLKRAEDAGARLILDGRKKPVPNTEGNYIGPSLIEWGSQHDVMPKDEIFGPTLEILHADTLDEAIAFQNASPYGNGTGIFTQNGAHAFTAATKLRAGMVGVNIGIPVPREPFSFGGIKASRFGQGGITGASLLDFLTDTIKVTTKWNPDDRKDWMS